MERGKSVSRLQRLKQAMGDLHQPDMPPVAHGEYLLAHLFEVGPAGSGGMGPAALTWLEIDAWKRACSVDLTPWAARMLRRLSAAYVSELLAAEDPARASPWADAPTRLAVTAVDMRASLRALAED